MHYEFWRLALPKWPRQLTPKQVFSKIILLPSTIHIQLWNHILFYYRVSQSTITFRIKSTLFTLCLCMKCILAQYKYIWCFILYTSYECFLEGHIRWFNTWPVYSLFHNTYNLWVTRNRNRNGDHVKKIGSQIEVRGFSEGQGEENGLPHAGQGLAEVQVLWW